MNRRVYIVIGAVITLLFVTNYTPIFSSVFSLLVLGMMPGTSLTIPVWAMLTIYPIVFIIASLWLMSQTFYIGETKKVEAKIKRVRKTKKVMKAAVAKKTKRTARRQPSTTTV